MRVLNGAEYGVLLDTLLKSVNDVKGAPAAKRLWDEMQSDDRRFDVVLHDMNIPGEALVPYEYEHEGGVAELNDFYKALARRRAYDPNRLEHPTIFINPLITYSIYADITCVRRQNNNPNGRIVGVNMKLDQPADLAFYVDCWDERRGMAGLIGRHPVVIVTKVELPPGVVFLHELGHVRQSYIKSEQYLQWIQNLADESVREQLEMDNLRLHEWPMCFDLAIGRRDNYKDDPHNDKLLPIGKPTHWLIVANPANRGGIEKDVRSALRADKNMGRAKLALLAARSGGISPIE